MNGPEDKRKVFADTSLKRLHPPEPDAQHANSGKQKIKKKSHKYVATKILQRWMRQHHRTTSEVPSEYSTQPRRWRSSTRRVARCLNDPNTINSQERQTRKEHGGKTLSPNPQASRSKARKVTYGLCTADFNDTSSRASPPPHKKQICILLCLHVHVVGGLPARCSSAPRVVCVHVMPGGRCCHPIDTKEGPRECMRATKVITGGATFLSLEHAKQHRCRLSGGSGNKQEQPREGNACCSSTQSLLRFHPAVPRPAPQTKLDEEALSKKNCTSFTHTRR